MKKWLLLVLIFFVMSCKASSKLILVVSETQEMLHIPCSQRFLESLADPTVTSTPIITLGNCAVCLSAWQVVVGEVPFAVAQISKKDYELLIDNRSLEN